MRSVIIIICVQRLNFNEKYSNNKKKLEFNKFSREYKDYTTMIIENDILVPFWKDKYKNICCGFTLPVLGNFALTRKSISIKGTTEENRIKLAVKFAFDMERIFYPHLNHSDTIIIVGAEEIGRGTFSLSDAIEGDACLTKLRNSFLSVTWADCIPVILFDPITGWIGTVHSGWKSTIKKILPKTIERLKTFGVIPENLLVAVGPGIRECCYTVGEDFIEKFKNLNLSQFIKVKTNEYSFDLAGSVYFQLLDNGCLERNIDFFGKCNCCSKEPYFFSCRRDKEKFEAQAAFIGQK